MVKNKKQNSDSDVVLIKLPQTFWGVHSHIDNIEYCIEQIENCAGKINNPVIGYYLVRCLGTREEFHRVLPQEKAEELKKNKEIRFRYETLDEFLRKKKDIEEGKYELRDGHIVDFSDSFLIKKINLPVNLSLLSHLDNIKYGIEQLNNYILKEGVIGCYLIKGCKTKETYYKILPKDLAEKFRKEEDRFHYYNLDDLLTAKEEIKEEKNEKYKKPVNGLRKKQIRGEYKK